jgi:hypothetical protein
VSVFEDRVRRGARLLDERVPTWFQRVDLTTLDLKWANVCVLGQVAHAEAGNYWSLYHELFGSDARQEHLYGFDLADIAERSQTNGRLVSDADWEGLRAAWVAEIEKRRAAAVDA